MEATMEKYYGTGRRKTAIAKVWITPGQGNFTVNGKQATEVFNRIAHQKDIFGPLKAVGMMEKVNVRADTVGGGISGQAGAIRLGVACSYSIANTPRNFWRYISWRTSRMLAWPVPQGTSWARRLPNSLRSFR